MLRAHGCYALAGAKTFRMRPPRRRPVHGTILGHFSTDRPIRLRKLHAALSHRTVRRIEQMWRPPRDSDMLYEVPTLRERVYDRVFISTVLLILTAILPLCLICLLVEFRSISPPPLHRQQRRAIKRLLSRGLPGVDQMLYSELGPGDFRVVVLEPGLEFDPVRCRLLVSHQSDKLPYEALSYVWGDPTKAEVIQCNGHQLGIPNNLYHALLCIRHANRPRLLWIDALCINQDDLKERGHQVKHMKQIFWDAARVIVWLGERQSDSGDIFAPLQQSWSREKSDMFILEKLLNEDQYFRFDRKVIRDPEFWDYIMFPPAPQRLIIPSLNILDLEKLLERPWFTRLWVIQEVAHAKEVNVMCGRDQVPWEWLANVVNDFHRAGMAEETLSKQAMTGVQAIIEIERARRRVLSSSELDMLSVLLATNDAQCSDLRDKVYGVLSLVDTDDFRTRPIEPDYSVDVTEVFKRVARWSIGSGSLDVLSCTTRRDGGVPGNPLDLPSWVPDWSCIDNLSPFIRYSKKLSFVELDNIKSKYRTHGSQSDLEPDITDMNELILWGRKIGLVRAVGRPSCYKRTINSRGITNPEILKVNRDWLEECKGLMAMFIKPLDRNAYCVLGKTIMANMSANGSLCSKPFVSNFLGYMTWLDDKLLGMEEPWQPSYEEDFKEIEAAIQTWSNNRCFAMLDQGTAALVPRGTKEGDLIVLFPQSNIPYVLRPDLGGQYIVVGESFVLDPLDRQGILFQEFEKQTLEQSHDCGFMEWLAGERYIIK